MHVAAFCPDNRFAYAAARGFLAFALAACAGEQPSSPAPPAPPPAPPPALLAPVAERFRIDGQIDLASVGTPVTQNVQLRADLGAGGAAGTIPFTWVATNDDRHLYIAAEWPDATRNNEFGAAGPVDVDGILLYFDDNGDGVAELNEDSKAALSAYEGTQYVDQRNATGPATDPVGDGLASIRYDAARQLYKAEFLIPVANDADGFDGVKNAQTRVNFVLFDHVRLGELSGNAGKVYGEVGLGISTTSWPRLPWSTDAVLPHPQIPAGLDGLIAFISDHEGVKELYTFRPATGEVRRVTNMPQLAFKEGVSVSHDRTRLAFFAAPTADAYSEYEIYLVNVDGAGFTRLTNNQLVDGHPAWSPNDAELVFASFRGDGRSKLVRMDTSGQELAVLTPDGVDDNDPDYLPDGRIVFKTDRFSASPLVRIAVMNADGSGVRQLSNGAGSSDHDPVSNGAVAVFERFTKPTSYVTDAESGFVGWDLVESNVDGTGSRTFLADGWINWLPVFAPGGQYLAYLKGVGYTDIQLMTRSGTALGRLVPGMTRVSYLDWK